MAHQTKEALTFPKSGVFFVLAHKKLQLCLFLRSISQLVGVDERLIEVHFNFVMLFV